MNPTNNSDQSMDGRPIPQRWTEKEAAKILHMSVCTLRKKRKKGIIGYHREGLKIYYDEDQLKAYHNSTKVDPK